MLLNAPAPASCALFDALRAANDRLKRTAGTKGGPLVGSPFRNDSVVGGYQRRLDRNRLDKVVAKPLKSVSVRG